jgi:hypothetical protein
MNDTDDSPADARPAIGADLIIPIAAVAFTLYFFSTVWDLSWEAKANGLVIGFVLLGLVAVLFVRVALQLRAGAVTLGFAPLLHPWRLQAQRIAIVALTALFVVVLPWLGLSLALFALIVALMLVMGVRRRLPLIATAVTITAATYLLFIALINARLPHGPVERLLAAIF